MKKKERVTKNNNNKIWRDKLTAYIGTMCDGRD